MATFVRIPISNYLDKPHRLAARYGNRIIMPPSSLDRLLSLDSMMKNLGLEEGAYMKIQPHTTSFLTNITDPNEVIETKPLNGMSLVETESEVGFVTPFDYKEPTKVLNKVPDKEAAQFVPFTGIARRLDGSSSIVKAECCVAEPRTDELKTSSREEEAAKFVPFTGIARRLDGLSSIVKADWCVAEPRTAELKTSSRVEEAAKFIPFTGVTRQLMDGSSSIVKAECCVAVPRTAELKISSKKRAGKVLFGKDDATTNTQGPAKLQKVNG